MLSKPQRSPARKGLLISESASLLRNYAALFKAVLRAHAGWFLAIPAYEEKYHLAYALFDCAECVTRINARLEEMRGGKPNASVRPELREWLLELPDAPDAGAYRDALVNVLLPSIRGSLDADLARLDSSANANEHRLLKALAATFAEPHHTLGGRDVDGGSDWAAYMQARLDRIGGLHGDAEVSGVSEAVRPMGRRFQRPRTIIFDERIQKRPLMRYEERLELDREGATVEQFRVFFNEFYAAALLASVLFDAAMDEYPWGFYADFARHLWDEARHSEFGYLRLRELGVEPDRVNPVLFEESEGLPVLHRIAYLTRGLEAYFMPRKPKRMKEYLDNGDERSQVFADQDWSDEINHVRYGSRWTDYLLEEDMRAVDDVIEEVKAHLGKVRGAPVSTIEAPF